MFTKLFRTVLASIGLVVFLVTAPFAAPLPAEKFSEAAQYSVGAGLMTCTGQDEIMAAKLVKGDETWVYWYNAENSRIVVAYFPKDATMPSEFGVGTVDNKTPGRHDYFPSLTWKKYEGEASPCDILVPKQA